MILKLLAFHFVIFLLGYFLYYLIIGENKGNNAFIFAYALTINFNKEVVMTLLDYSKKVVLGDITIRDGLQHEEKFIPTDAKLWLAEQLVLAGFKRIEVTNFGNPQGP